MKIIIISATEMEFRELKAHLTSNPGFNQNNVSIQFIVSGVGMLSSTYTLTKIALKESPDLIIQMGIAGSFDRNLSLGEVVVIKKEVLGDMGVEEHGIWNDPFDLKLSDPNESPFDNGALTNPWLNNYNLLQLPEVTALTVNQISTNEKRIAMLSAKYKASLESMEGVALHYVARKENIPFIQIRSISNYAGERDKSKWLMKESISNLNSIVLQLVEKLIVKK